MREIESLELLKQAFAPFEEVVNYFVIEKGVGIERFYHDLPCYMIGRSQRIEDLNKIWWNIQFCYVDGGFSLQTVTWIDSEEQVDGGVLHERRLSPPEINFSVAWNRDETVNLKELLEQAYQRANVLQEEDLTVVSSYIRDPVNVIRSVAPP